MLNLILECLRRCEKEHPSIKFNTGYYVGDKMSILKAAIK